MADPTISLSDVGDVNQDGTVDIVDVNAAMQAGVSEENLSGAVDDAAADNSADSGDGLDPRLLIGAGAAAAGWVLLR